jgi:hypothetical protein
MATEFVCVSEEGNLCIATTEYIARKFIRKHGQYALFRCTAVKGWADSRPLNNPKWIINDDTRKKIRKVLTERVWPIVQRKIKIQDAQIHILTSDNFDESARFLAATV